MKRARSSLYYWTRRCFHIGWLLALGCAERPADDTLSKPDEQLPQQSNVAPAAGDGTAEEPDIVQPPDSAEEPLAGDPESTSPADAPVARADVETYFIYISNEYGADISVIDTATDDVVKTITVAGRPGEVRPRGMAVSPDGGRIFVSVSDFHPQYETPEDKITVIDVEQNEVVLEISAGGNPERLAVNPAGTEVWAALEAVAQGAGYDAQTGEQIAYFQTGAEPEGAAISPNGRWVYITAETTHTVTVFDRETLSAVNHVFVGNRPRYIVFSHDGRRAYVSAEIGGTVSVIDAEQHQLEETISLGLDARPVEMALSPDGDRLYVVAGGTNAVYVIDTATHEVVETIRQQIGRRPWGITITPDGRKLYTANGLSDSVSVIDTDCLCVIDNITVGRGPHSAEVGTVPASD